MGVIASRLEAIALRLEASASRLEAIASGGRSYNEICRYFAPSSHLHDSARGKWYSQELRRIFGSLKELRARPTLSKLVQDLPQF